MTINGLDRWNGLDLRHLAALDAVARTGSFARAAQELGYTQPAVSQQIAGLERIVGQRLFERRSGPGVVEPTEAGELLLRHAQAIQARLAAAQADMAALADGSGGTLRIGTFQSVAARVLPELIRSFAERWPQVHVQLVEQDDDQQLLDLLERGELDLTYVMFPFREGPFDYVEVLRDNYVLVVAVDSPLADGVGLDEIGELPLIGYRSCRSSELAEDHLRARGVQPRVVFRSDDNGTVQGFVRAGFGVALVPELAVDRDDPGVVLLDLPEMPPRQIGIACHRDRYRSPAAQAFVELALEAEVARV
jgi:molybdate transport repressor ModE-like protein